MQVNLSRAWFLNYGFSGNRLFWQCVLVRSNSSSVAGGYEYNDAADCDNELCAPSGKFVSGITLVLSMLPALFETLSEMSLALGVEVRFHINRNARIESVGKYQSCMVSKLRIIWKRTRTRARPQL